MRNFHWNVTGPDFFELHGKFEEQYNEAKVNIDAIAERIRVFGQKPESNFSKYLEMSEIKEAGVDLTSMQMVQETLKDLELLLSQMVDVADAGVDSGDAGTLDMINSFINKIETTHWMLTAWSK